MPADETADRPADDTTRDASRVSTRDTAADAPAPDNPVARAAAIATGQIEGTETERKVMARSVYLILVAVLLGAAVLMVAVAGEVYESVVESDGVAALDRPALLFAVSIRTPVLTALAVAFTEIAGRIGIPAIAIALMALLAWRRRDWTPVILLATGLLGSLLLTVVGKEYADRVRPPQDLALPPFEHSPAFPSGHSLNSMVLAALTAYLVIITARAVWARWVVTVVCLLFPIVVALSRVYLGQHWLTDVLAGLALGIAWSFAVITAHRIWRRLRQRRKRKADERAAVHPADARPAAS